MPDWQPAGYVCQFYVDAQHRQQGVGQALFDAMMAWFRDRGLARIRLNVDLDNPVGQKFWRKQGFQPLVTRMGMDV